MVRCLYDWHHKIRKSWFDLVWIDVGVIDHSQNTKIYWMFVAAMLCSCAAFDQTASLSSALPSSSPSSSEKTSSSSSMVPMKAHYLNCYVDNELYVTLKIYQGALLSLPTDPKKEGYIFAGWYFDEGIYQNQVKQDSFLRQELTEDFYSCYARFIEEQGIQYYVNFYVDSSLYSSTPLLSNELIAMPVRLIQRMVQISTDGDDIVVDFFSGAASSAHSIMSQNTIDNGNRRFIMVQIPEPVDNKYRNLCEVGWKRRPAGSFQTFMAVTDWRRIRFPCRFTIARCLAL